MVRGSQNSASITIQCWSDKIELMLHASVRRDRGYFRQKKPFCDFTQQPGLNAKYAATLWAMLNDNKPSPVLDIIRQRFRTASPGDATAVAQLIQDWQRSLWRWPDRYAT